MFSKTKGNPGNSWTWKEHVMIFDVDCKENYVAVYRLPGKKKKETKPTKQKTTICKVIHCKKFRKVGSIRKFGTCWVEADCIHVGLHRYRETLTYAFFLNLLMPLQNTEKACLGSSWKLHFIFLIHTEWGGELLSNFSWLTFFRELLVTNRKNVCTLILCTG